MERAVSEEKVYETASPEATVALGSELIAQLQPPKLTLLSGNLGAGKTTLVKGIVEGFKAAAQEEVTSPTFTLIHEYRSPEADIYHIDLYRIDTQRELETLGIDDLFGPRSLIIIEWGEKFDRFRKERDVEIVIERTGEEQRRIRISR
ncbi:MAG TPA: tRNA (adenosine(37)-N6)-threonylcarbamoyltransferase complex ATPase subunit type 1 TsaE [Terriglobales bacterium]|jgi:tRNA threonylcarbamoyladenosine biosynthesis protein TsaE|nr:tRNA (adenosine(37)-N6)-threonylcarbamoyltransferase complex ATPase subunit type 1 TsaE [Terriglobales bacterium]